MKKLYVYIGLAFLIGIVIGYQINRYKESSFRDIKSFMFVDKIMKEVDKDNDEKVIYWTCRAIQNKPDSEILYGILADIYYEKNQWKMAVEMYNLAISFTDDTHNNRLRYLKMKSEECRSKTTSQNTNL